MSSKKLQSKILSRSTTYQKCEYNTSCCQQRSHKFQSDAIDTDIVREVQPKRCRIEKRTHTTYKI